MTVAEGPFETESKAYTAATNIKDADEFPLIKCYRVGTLAEAKSIYRQEQSSETGRLGPTLQPIRSTDTAMKWKHGAKRFDEIKRERGIE